MKVQNVHFVSPVKYRKKYKKIQVLGKLGKVSPPAANWRAKVALLVMKAGNCKIESVYNDNNKCSHLPEDFSNFLAASLC